MDDKTTNIHTNNTGVPHLHTEYSSSLDERASEISRYEKIDSGKLTIKNEIDKYKNKIATALKEIENKKDEIEGYRKNINELEIELNFIDRIGLSEHVADTQNQVKNECIRCLQLEDEKRKNEEKTIELNGKIEKLGTQVIELESQNKELQEKLLKSEVTNQKLVQAGYTDHLTKIGNRIKFNEDAKLLIDKNDKFSIAFIDIDHFKNINDTYGHSSGDLILRFLASKLKMAGNVYRRGGEEFLIVSKCDESELKVKLENVKNGCLRSKYELPDTPGSEVKINFSAGVIQHQAGLTLTQLTKYADALMYEAKHTRDTIITFQESNNAAQQNSQSVSSGKI